ncbi:MAG: DUF262 domain-containing protein [Candidatus Gastranaerophilales bacterium]|nr:DUF262 domain-containing protein [Candidatus Gastranaerophilales bacterium]
MSGYNDWSIYETIRRINEGKMFLPALQRKFVWKAEQIIELFDSILRGYPIGTFLFWNLEEVKNINAYSFYEFLNHYDEESNKHNALAPFPQLENKEGYYGVLDGQQRLSSLYLALQGTYKFKKSRERYARERKLFIDLTHEINNEQIEDAELTYKLDFLSKEEIEAKKKNEYWFEVRAILTFNDIEQANEKADAIVEETPELQSKAKIIRRNLRKLFDVISADKKIINFFNVENKELDEVLDIFVRVNSGGTVLSKTDLLMSTIVVHWEEARSIFDNFVEELNGDKKFKFNIDLIVRTALCLIGQPAKVEVKSFNAKVVKEIKEKWDNIKIAIENMINLLKSFGFTDSTMTSYLATIPISCYIYNGGDIKSEISKSQIRNYITIALINQIFGRASNSVIDNLKKSLTETNSFDYLINKHKKEFEITNEGLEEILIRNKKDAYSLMILTFLYPEKKFEQINFHQDHLHPVARFNEKELEQQGKDWFNKRNSIPNLHILEETENQSKNDTSLIEWRKTHIAFKDKFIDDSMSYDFADFENFYNKRKENIKNAIIKELGNNYIENTITIK